MKKVRIALAAIVTIAGIGGAVASQKALLPNVRIVFSNGTSAIRDLQAKGQTWDCQNTQLTACYYSEETPGSGIFTVPSATRGYAIPLP